MTNKTDIDRQSLEQAQALCTSGLTNHIEVGIEQSYYYEGYSSENK